ncbi:MAG: hypothetical protein QOG53_212 [Frankiales bacterium]|nr:hypothetical protein [Frankiales bacterium]
MRLPDSAHTSRPWRIHEIAPEFRLEDVWALPTPGGPDDFGRLVHGWAVQDPTRHPSFAVRSLFAIRLKLGALFGWDDEKTGVGSRVPTLLDRLPADLRDAPRPEFDTLPFKSLYLTDNEFAAEAANRTMHGVLHLGWVRDDDGDGYHGQMAILVKRNGLLGSAYMAGIAPFRHLIVYPQLTRSIGRDWQQLSDDPTLSAHA